MLLVSTSMSQCLLACLRTLGPLPWGQRSKAPHTQRFTNELETPPSPAKSPLALSGALGVGGSTGGNHASEGFDLKRNKRTSPRTKQPFPLSREAARRAGSDTWIPSLSEICSRPELFTVTRTKPTSDGRGMDACPLRGQEVNGKNYFSQC